jgi:hypothetical protein
MAAVFGKGATVTITDIDLYRTKPTEYGTGLVLCCGDDWLGVFPAAPELAEHIVELLNADLEERHALGTLSSRELELVERWKLGEFPP